MRAAGSSAGDRSAGRPWSCRYMRHAKVCPHFGKHAFVLVALRGERGWVERAQLCCLTCRLKFRFWQVLSSFLGEAQFIFSVAEGRSVGDGGVARRGESDAKREEGDAFLFFGFLTREKTGKKGAKKARKKCINGDASLLSKNRRKNASARIRHFFAQFTKKAEMETRNCSSSWSAVGGKCTGFVDILGGRSELNRKGTPKGEERGERSAVSSVGGRIAGWPRSCRYLRYTKVRPHIGIHPASSLHEGQLLALAFAF